MHCLKFWGVTALALLLSSAGPVRAGTPLKVGLLRLTSSAPVFIAVDQGYFRDEGLEVEQVFFKSAQPIAVALAAGDIAVGATGFTAGLYNALAGGLNAVLVADKGRVYPGYRLVGLMVSNQAWDQGLRTVRDLKGRRVGITQLGSTFHYMLGNLLSQAGLSLEDVKVTPLGGVKTMLDTLASNQIDCAFMVQPFCTDMETKKTGHILLWVSDSLSYQIAGIFFGEDLAKDRPAALAFLRAYIRGCRFYFDNCLTLKDGQAVKGAHFGEAVASIAKYTGGTPDEVAMGLNYNDRDGRLDLEDIQRQIDWFFGQKLLDRQLDAKAVVDLGLWEEALKQLGP